MRFYNVDMKGKFFIQENSPGAAVAADERRIVYDAGDLKYSDGSDWYKFWTEKNTDELAQAISTDPTSIAYLASVFLRKDQADSTPYTLNVGALGSSGNVSALSLTVTGASATVNGAQVWTSGNDGSGSGLDADQLDGQHGSYYRNAGNLNAGTVPVARLSGTYNISITGSARYA